MESTKRYIASFVFVGALVSPLAILAVPQDATVKVRIYDKDHKDYHYWDDKENRAWGRFGKAQEGPRVRKSRKERAGGILELAAQPSGLI
jgi:hypothetical protein